MSVVAFVPDLMDRSRVSAAIADVRFVARVEDLAAVAAPGDVVVVDLGRPGVLDALATIDARIVGFAPHVDRELLDAARHAGCDEVRPRSAFFSRLAEIVRDV